MIIMLCMFTVLHALATRIDEKNDLRLSIVFPVSGRHLVKDTRTPGQRKMHERKWQGR